MRINSWGLVECGLFDCVAHSLDWATSCLMGLRFGYN